MDESFRQILQYFKLVPQKPSIKSIVVVGIFCLLLLIIVEIHNFKRRYEQKKKYHNLVKKLIVEAKEKGLNEEEIDALTMIAHIQYIKNPLSLIISQTSFEKALDTMLHKKKNIFIEHKTSRLINIYLAIRRKLFLVLPGENFYLVSSRQIPAGKTVWIKRTGNQGENPLGFIVQAVSKTGLEVRGGSSKEYSKMFSTGNSVEVMFRQKGNIKYIFNTTVLRQSSDDPSVYMLDHVPEMRLSQEDENFRVATHILFQYTEVSHSSNEYKKFFESENHDEMLTRTGILHDISPGGLTFTTLSRIIVDDGLYIEIDIHTEGKYLYLKAIARSVKRETQELPFLVQAEFINLTEDQRNTLVKHFNTIQLSESNENASGVRDSL